MMEKIKKQLKEKVEEGQSNNIKITVRKEKGRNGRGKVAEVWKTQAKTIIASARIITTNTFIFWINVISTSYACDIEDESIGEAVFTGSIASRF